MRYLSWMLAEVVPSTGQCQAKEDGGTDRSYQRYTKTYAQKNYHGSELYRLHQIKLEDRRQVHSGRLVKIDLPPLLASRNFGAPWSSFGSS
jgi:hypothetical protein